jgi:hypothetical protein
MCALLTSLVCHGEAGAESAAAWSTIGTRRCDWGQQSADPRRSRPVPRPSERGARASVSSRARGWLSLVREQLG